MQVDGQVIAPLIVGVLSFGVLWWLAGKLRGPRLGALCSDSLSDLRRALRRVVVFSAETVGGEEAEFIDEHRYDMSALLPWLVRVPLILVYLLALIWLTSAVHR